MTLTNNLLNMLTLKQWYVLQIGTLFGGIALVLFEAILIPKGPWTMIGISGFIISGISIPLYLIVLLQADKLDNENAQRSRS